MGLFKFQNYSAIKNAKDNPRVKATKVTKNGYVFEVKDNVTVGSEVFKEAGVPLVDDASAKTAQLYVAMNIVDKPETLNYDDYQVEIGEYIRAINLNNQIGELVELSSDLCTTVFASVNKGDILIPIPSGTNEMKWKVATGTDIGYGICLEVVEKTTFGAFTIDGVGGGYTCRIKSN